MFVDPKLPLALNKDERLDFFKALVAASLAGRMAGLNDNAEAIQCEKDDEWNGFSHEVVAAADAVLWEVEIRLSSNKMNEKERLDMMHHEWHAPFRK